MEDNISQQTFGKKVWTLISLIIAFMLLGQFLSAGLMFAYYGNDAFNFEKILSNKNDSFNIIRIVQIVASIISFALPAIIFSKIYHKNACSYSFEQHKPNVLLWLIVPFLIITIYSFLNLTYVLNKESFLGTLMPEQQEQYKMFIEALINKSSIAYFIFNFLMIALMPAFVEEWIFRGTLQKLLSEKLNAHVAIIISSIIFSLIHFEFSGFLPRIFLGMLLGYVFYLSKDIWLCIWMHLFNNGMEVTLMYFKVLENKQQELFQEPTMPKTYELIGYSLLFILLMVVFYRISKRNKKAIFAD
jgi:hypothetical protein